jgi:hypothetical protein
MEALGGARLDEAKAMYKYNKSQMSKSGVE